MRLGAHPSHPPCTSQAFLWLLPACSLLGAPSAHHLGRGTGLLHSPVLPFVTLRPGFTISGKQPLPLLLPHPSSLWSLPPEDQLIEYQTFPFYLPSLLAMFCSCWISAGRPLVCGNPWHPIYSAVSPMKWAFISVILHVLALEVYLVLPNTCIFFEK